MKYLGIDFGTKRIGLSLSDETGSLAFPLTTIGAGEGAPGAVGEIIEKEGVGEVVIGESQNFAGEANPVMAQIEEFKKNLEALPVCAGVPVVYEKEVFTSTMAARQFAPDGSRKSAPSQERLDASAAALILQSYLDRIKNN